MSRSPSFRRPLKCYRFSAKQCFSGPGVRNKDQISDMVFDRLNAIASDIEAIGFHDVGEGRKTLLNTDHLRRRFARVQRLMDEVAFLNKEYEFSPEPSYWKV